MEGLRQLRGVWNQAPHQHSWWPLRLPLRARSPPAPDRPRHFFADDEQLLSSRPFPPGQEGCACRDRAFPRCCCLSRRWLHGIACDPLLTTRLAIMGMLAILLIVMTILTWYFTSTHAQRSVSAVAASLRHELLTHAQQATNAVIRDNNASTVSLARLLNFTAVDYSSFSTLDTQVRSALFTVYSALPKKRTVSFYGKNGMFISYNFNINASSLCFSNTSYLDLQGNQTSIPWNSQENITATRPWYRAYRQRLDTITGSSIEDPITFPAVPFWGRTTFNVSLYTQPGASFWSFVLQPPADLRFQTYSPVRQGSSTDAVGVAAIGVSMTEVHDLLAGLDLQGGDMYLVDNACRLLAQTRDPVDIGVGQFGTPILPLASASKNSVVAGAARYLESKLPDCSMLTQNKYQGGNAVIDGTRYLIDASPVHLAQLTLVCVIVIPHKSIWGSSDRRSNATLAVLVVLAVCAGLVGCFFVILLTKGVSNEMRLRAQLLQQHEARKEAETKSSQKSIVFASMSHDLRTPLAAIIGLIDICLCEAAESTELESNLLQMKSCAENLLGILNSVLDMSKIEAGKLQLIEKDFDIVHALEEVVDMFAVVGTKKGLEVVLDLPDDSIESLSRVRGDEGRVKQLLSNLLSNGVKFTSEGHVVVRAWPKYSSSMAAVHTFRHIEGIMGSLTYPFRRWFYGRRKSYKQMRAMYERYAASSNVEFEFEVDDTGKGIPRDRRKAVFDNFVQVDTSTPQTNGGTGLGLGIVRSLVRLMGGDIAIVDKAEPGEPGTCFRFNLVFSRVAKFLDSEEVQDMKSYQSKDTRVPDRASVREAFGSSGRAVPLWSFRSSSGRHIPSGLLNDPYASPPLAEGVNVLLAMQGIAGKRVVRRWMERRGLQVSIVNIWEDFLPGLEKIRREIFYDESFSGFSERFEIASPGTHSFDLWTEEMEARRRVKEWTSNPESGLTQQILESEGGRTAFPKYVDRTGARLLILIDADMILEPLSSVAVMLQGGLTREEQHALSRVVWLVTTNTPSHIVQALKDGSTIPCDLCLHKPLHGSRLLSVWELVQELTGKSERKQTGNGGGGHSSRSVQSLDYKGRVVNTSSADAASQVRVELSSVQKELNVSVKEGNLIAGENDKVVDICGSQSAAERCITGQTSGVASSKFSGHGNSEGSVSDVLVVSKVQSQAADLETLPPKLRVRESEMMGPPDALSKKLVLVAEDNKVLQKLTRTILIKMGATVDCVDDGADAVRMVVSNLPRPSRVLPPQALQKVPDADDQLGGPEEQSTGRPYDMVFMDCQMPVLDGYEATIRIREEEKAVGWRTPVIALTAHAMAQDERKCIDAGMDFYLTKPLSTKALLDVISKVNLGTWNQGTGE